MSTAQPITRERKSIPPKNLSLFPRPRTPPQKPEVSNEITNQTSTQRNYPGVFERPFQNPYEILCHSYNVAVTSIKVTLHRSLPNEIYMTVLEDAHMPTHILAITDTPLPLKTMEQSSYPILAPINAELFSNKFTNDHIARISSHLAAPGSTLPIPFWDSETQRMVVKLPVIPLVAPHPPSIPLLLLFGLELHLRYSEHSDMSPLSRRSSPQHRGSFSSSSIHSTDTTSTILSPSPSPTFSPSSSPISFKGRRRSPSRTNPTYNSHPSVPTGLLATYLLPLPVIEECPASTLVLAEKMVQCCSNPHFEKYVEQNQGLWKNVLLLAPKDEEIIELVRFAWNITVEAKKIKERSQGMAN
ncbi:hypothetical protein C8Q75DRAFT_808034 [Abortiporus biennis]|nr:hypothetical protein C8Q75DRAFT_808034 [Abortiporus biennis]